jgi:hypothetical protein
MAAVEKVAEATIDDVTPELGWTREAVEPLSEDEVVGLLLRRMRKLSERGFDPCEALIAASRVGFPTL